MSDASRRNFLKAATLGAGAMLLNGCATEANAAVPGIKQKRRMPLIGGSSADVVVIGAGVWGAWTALHLRQMGAKVTLVDAYGPANVHATSGDETRGMRSSYGDREAGELWVQWAVEGMRRWQEFDKEWSEDLRQSLWHTTGDLILRAEEEPFTKKSLEWWKKHNVPHEILTADEVRYRWPVINADGMNVIISEPGAGVIRARRATQAVVTAFETLGGKIAIGRARTSKIANGKLEEIALDTGHTLRADTFIFAVGPWVGKMFPDILYNRTRTPLGYVVYFGTPPGDERFTYPNLPSWNFEGVTGWAALPVDNRGFRVRGGLRQRPAPAPAGQAAAAPNARGAERQPGTTQGGAGASSSRSAERGGSARPAGQATPPRPQTPPEQLDPDLSNRWADAARIESTRRVLVEKFPIIANAPVLQTHACHYESTSSRDFIIDRHPRMSNVWLAAGGNAEGFEFAPVVGEYVSQRALGDDGDPEIAKRFLIPPKEYDPPPAPGANAAAGQSAAPTAPPRTQSRPSR